MRAIIIAVAAMIALLLLGLGWFALRLVLPAEDRAFVAGDGGAAVDSGARYRIVTLETQIDALRAEIEGLRSDIATLRLAIPSAPQATGPLVDPTPPGTGLKDDFAKVVEIPDRRKLNLGLTVATPTFLEGFLGKPREVLSDNCEAMSNPKLRDMLNTESVGPINVSMLQPAIDSLRTVFEEVKRTDQELYDRIRSSGSLCVRQIRGTSGRTSTHSFGLALDINIDGTLDQLGDGLTQLGLVLMADFFLVEGWVWGAAYGREDSMHFEVSRETLEQWRAEGRI